MKDINTFLVNMDVLISEQVVKNSDDSYSIFLNSRLTHEKQLEAYKHAIEHIENCDYEKYDVDKIEFDAHSA